MRSARRAKITRVRGKGSTERTVFLSNDARAGLADYLEQERPADAGEDASALFLSACGLAARSADGRLSVRAVNLILEQIGCWHDAEVRDPVRRISPLHDHSRAVAAYRLSVQPPSALQTALTLRQAIWRKGDSRWRIRGIPETFYTDHSSDFTSQHVEQVGVDLKMELVFSAAGRPRGRGRIERFFQTLDQLLFGTLPGYAPRGTPRPAPTLTLAALDARLGVFLLEEHHYRPHGETGVAPVARWEDGGFLPQLPASLEQLDLLLLAVAKPRVVQQDGIHFQGLRYLDVTLAAYFGEPVVVRYDPNGLADIRV